MCFGWHFKRATLYIVSSFLDLPFPKHLVYFSNANGSNHHQEKPRPLKIVNIQTLGREVPLCKCVRLHNTYMKGYQEKNATKNVK